MSRRFEVLSAAAMAPVAALVTVLAGAVTVAPAPARAQTPPATIGDRYIPAPWWMRDPVIASIGQVRTELPANRASVQAGFIAVERTAAEASRRAAEQVRALSQALGGYGVEAVQVQTSLSVQPLYDQYRDESGVLRDNARADRIERYQASANVSLAVRDIALLERVYATLVAAQPTSIGQVYFSLDPDNAWRANLAAEAMKDARRRALAAVQNAGAALGPVRIIDPSGRVCQTDVLAGWPSYAAGGGAETLVDDIVVTGSRLSAPPPPPPPPPPAAPGEAAIEAARLTLQPPLMSMSDTACVIYALG